jgi:hypothetical protein
MKIGVVYCKPGQVSNTEMFANGIFHRSYWHCEWFLFYVFYFICYLFMFIDLLFFLVYLFHFSILVPEDCGPNFFKFIDYLGRPIDLEGWTKYRGDMRPPGKCWYDEWNNIESMFACLSTSVPVVVFDVTLCVFFFFSFCVFLLSFQFNMTSELLSFAWFSLSSLLPRLSYTEHWRETTTHRYATFFLFLAYFLMYFLFSFFCVFVISVLVFVYSFYYACFHYSEVLIG